MGVNEIQRISELFQRVYGGSSWHGPALRDLLSDVTAERAGVHAIPGSPSIWQVVLHIVAWQDFAARAITEGDAADPAEDSDWPHLEPASEAVWSETLDTLRLSQKRLRLAIEALPEERLAETVPGRAYPVYQMLYGVIHHALYHAGQIGTLKRAIEEREE